VLGVCEGHDKLKRSVHTASSTGGKVSKGFGVPTYLLSSYWSNWKSHSAAQLRLSVSPEAYPLPNGWVLVGFIDVDFDANDVLSCADRGGMTRQLEVVCRPANDANPSVARPADCYPFVVRTTIAMEWVEGRVPSINVTLEPRAMLENMLPTSIAVRSPMPHIFGLVAADGDGDVFELQSRSCIEIFTSGPSIAVLIKCSDKPVGGTATGWMEGGWIDLPLVAEFRLPEPLRCVFPFLRTDSVDTTRPSRGSEFFITQGSPNLSDSFLERVAKGSVGSQPDPMTPEIEVSLALSERDAHIFYVTACNSAVDHTGDILFEQVTGHQPLRGSVRRSFVEAEAKRGSFSQPFCPLGAYATQLHRGRVTLLPAVLDPIRLVHLTMEGDEGFRRSAPFRVEDMSICDGGIEATPLNWENGSQSGFFAYRQLVSANQSEIHVVPEYIVFNGSKKDRVQIRQPGGLEFTVEPGSIAPLYTSSHETAVISVECLSIGGRTAPLRIDSLGLRVAIVKSKEGYPLGSLAMQTVVGGRDSRLVVKLGEVKFSSRAESTEEQRPSSSSLGILQYDFLRFRVQWSSLEVSLYEARPVTGKGEAFVESALDRITQISSPQLAQQNQYSEKTWVEAREKLALARDSSQEQKVGLGPVCTILFHRFTIDWQRVFKDETPTTTREPLRYPERSQLSIIIHHIQIRDDTPNSPLPIVLESAAKLSFFDLCVRFKGPLDADLVRIDLFDLNLAHANGVSERIVVKTSEDFVWKFLDLANRIVVAAGEFSGVNLELVWDNDHDGYKVLARDKKPSYIENATRYSPPESDLLLDVNKARVSPFTVLISFKRNPQAPRYAVVRGVRGANIMNYFSRKLKFTIDRAELQFAAYEARNVKGPPDRLWEILSTVYMSRMKLKLVTLMSAASFQDWKKLADRDGGDDAFVQGDLLRAAGNLSGKTASYVLANTGRGLGQGISFATGALGNGIENATSAVGVKPLGAGVNSVVSGVGDGVAKTLTGGMCVCACR
jgi:hypothetical protein